MLINLTVVQSVSTVVLLFTGCPAINDGMLKQEG